MCVCVCSCVLSLASGVMWWCEWLPVELFLAGSSQQMEWLERGEEPEGQLNNAVACNARGGGSRVN